jgi:lambda repressor-like predicted transcriptional regulator
MKKTKQDWASHVAAIKAQGISPIAYAKQNGLAQSTLYSWQHKLQAASTIDPKAKTLTASPRPGKFIALRLSEPERMVPSSSAPTHCTLILSGGVRLDMPTLPTPQWLADLARCTQGVH